MTMKACVIAIEIIDIMTTQNTTKKYIGSSKIHNLDDSSFKWLLFNC